MIGDIFVHLKRKYGNFKSTCNQIKKEKQAISVTSYLTLKRRQRTTHRFVQCLIIIFDILLHKWCGTNCW